jgi:SNF2 family DNA or RNA helicase
MSLIGLSLGLKMVVTYDVLMLNLWWNPSNEDQVVDRAHRIGQTQPVTVSTGHSIKFDNKTVEKQ